MLDKAPKVRGFNEKHDYVSEDEYLTFEEADRFLRAAAPEWRTFLVVALKTGLRVGELLALQWQDVDLVAGHLIVRRTLWNGQEGPPKGGRNRKVPLSDDRARRAQGAPAPPGAVRLLRRIRQAPQPLDGEGRRPRRPARRAKLAKRVTTHGLRHTFASHLVMRGASLKAVQELLGHESIEMTLRYSHLTPDVKRDAVRLLDRTEDSGDIRETEEAEKRTPRRTGGLDGAGKGI